METVARGVREHDEQVRAVARGLARVDEGGAVPFPALAPLGFDPPDFVAA
jgi:hypothetical protein